MPALPSNKSSNSPSSSSTTSPQSRLSQVSQHIAPMASSTNFSAQVVPQAPEDPLFGLMAAYRKDESPNKVDLGIGAYRDDNAKPWILPVVRKASTACRGRLRLSVTLQCCILTACLTGRRHHPQRPQPQPRIPSHLRSRRIHFCLTEAHPRRRQPRDQGEAG